MCGRSRPRATHAPRTYDDHALQVTSAPARMSAFELARSLAGTYSNRQEANRGKTNTTQTRMCRFKRVTVTGRNASHCMAVSADRPGSTVGLQQSRTPRASNRCGCLRSPLLALAATSIYLPQSDAMSPCVWFSGPRPPYVPLASVTVNGLRVGYVAVSLKPVCLSSACHWLCRVRQSENPMQIRRCMQQQQWHFWVSTHSYATGLTWTSAYATRGCMQMLDTGEAIQTPPYLRYG